MKWFFRIIGAVAVTFVALLAVLFLLPAEKIAQIATDQLRASTGRDVSISGDVALTFWPVLGVRAGGLEVANASWAEQGPLLQASQAAIGVDARSLLSGDIVITNIEAENPTIRLEQRLDGRASWEFTDASGAASIETSTTPARAPRSLSIQKLTVTNATLIYDAEGSDLVSYSNVDLNIDWPDRLGPADITAQLVPNGTAVSAVATIDGFAGFITGDVQTLRATIEGSSGTLDFNGRASTAGAVAGALALTTTNTGTFLRELGLEGIALPPKLGQKVMMTSDITLTPDRRLALRDLDADLTGNRITGAADMSLNGIPQINATLDAGDLDLVLDDSAPESVSNISSKRQDGWSKSSIDASVLSSFNGDIALTASSIDLGDFQLGPTRAVLRNDNARMVFQLTEVNAYDGRILGEFVMNNRNGLSVGGKLSAISIEMQTLLSDAIDFDRLTGKANVELGFLGSGNSVHAIMNSLDGSGTLALQRGTIQGFDLDEILRSGRLGTGTTVFEDVTGSWRISDGILKNDDLLLQLKNYEASGQGQVGLGSRTINYTVTPVALRANSGEGLAVPVLFKGPWDDVSIRPDLEAVLEERFDEEKDALEERAKQEISERLGIEPAEGQSTEDALKEKLNNTLRSLFD